MQTKRECGILMPLASLPGPGGIGCFGREAYAFVDFLADAGQSIWQLLPLGPTGYGDSPYQSCSAFAGNPYFIDLDTLAAEGLLRPEEYEALPWGENAGQVDYEAVYTHRFGVLRAAYARWKARRPVPGCETPCSDEYYRFCFLNDSWLEDYALYMAAKEECGMRSYLEWPAPLRRREPQALAELAGRRAEEIGFWKFVQFTFSRQWVALKGYANAKGVRIMGDLPIYVSADSADAWAGRSLFEMDGEGRPTRVAGCPPDYFSADGQLWGNPLYHWPHHRETGYAWWAERLRCALRLYDIVRIDHFRGFDTYWAIPAESPTARVGRWEQGPGMELFEALRRQLGELPIVAEDLGELFDSVRVLLRESGFPGMKVLQFAFTPGQDSEYLPHNHEKNFVVYPGTHDNTTIAGWLTDTAAPGERAKALAYLGLTERDSLETQVRGFVRGALASPARIAVIPLADWLALGAEARINQPGVLGGNWGWRAKDGVCTPALAKEIRALCAVFGRAEPLPEDPEKLDERPEEAPDACKKPPAPADPAEAAAPAEPHAAAGAADAAPTPPANKAAARAV